MTRHKLTRAQTDWVRRTIEGAHRDVREAGVRDAEARAMFHAIAYVVAVLAVLWLLRGRA